MRKSQAADAPNFTFPNRRHRGQAIRDGSGTENYLEANGFRQWFPRQNQHVHTHPLFAWIFQGPWKFSTGAKPSSGPYGCFTRIIFLYGQGKRTSTETIFFVLSQDNHNLRGHKLKLYKSRSRSRFNTRKFFYSQRVVNVWNKLSSNVIEAETVITFKNRLDKCEYWGI